MVDSPVLQWALTVLFALTAGYSLLRLWRDRGAIGCADAVLHLLMSVAMVVMVWPWGMGVLLVPQVALFGAATLWYCAVWLAVVRDGRLVRRLGGHPAWHQLAHAAMMAAMVWMLVTMAPTDAAVAHDGGHGSHGGLDVWLALLGVAFLVALAAIAAAQAADGWRCLRDKGSFLLAHAVDDLAGALMGVGMVAMSGPMIMP